MYTQESAAGIICLIKAAMCLENKLIPGNPFLQDLNEHFKFTDVEPVAANAFNLNKDQRIHLYERNTF